MGDININDAERIVRHVDTYTRTVSGQTLHMQSMVSVDANTGIPLAGVFDQLLDKSGGNTVYVCYAPVGSATSSPVWQVQRIVTSAGITTTRYAGTGAFDQIADNRASLPYGV